MKVLIHKSDGTKSLMQLFPHSVVRKSDGKVFALNDKMERRGKMMVTHVLAVEPTPLKDLPPAIAAAATTPVHEGFKATFDAALMRGEVQNEEWEFVYPDADAEVEKWKGLPDDEIVTVKGEPRSDNRYLYVSHEVVAAADYVGVRASDLSKANARV